MCRDKHTHTNSIHPLTQPPSTKVCAHTDVYSSPCHTHVQTTSTMPPNTCVGTTPTVNAQTRNICQPLPHVCKYHRHTLTLTTHTCRQFMHTCTPHTCDIPSPLRAEPHHSSPAAQLTPPPCPCSLPPHPTWCPGTCRPSPGLLSCRRMARKKSWENMALLPSPSCSMLPPQCSHSHAAANLACLPPTRIPLEP